MSFKSFAYKISAWNRKRKWDIFKRELNPTDRDRILDVGFSERECSQTCNFIEKHYPVQENLTAIGIDEPAKFKERYPRVKAIKYDGTYFPFPPLSFDICWSNAVIEHVGDHDRQLLFLQEIRRCAERGFITTPNRLFPVEVHTRVPLLHWLPKRWFDAFLRLIGKKWATGDYMHLLSERDLHDLLARAGIMKYQIIRNKLCGFTLDFVVIF